MDSFEQSVLELEKVNAEWLIALQAWGDALVSYMEHKLC